MFVVLSVANIYFTLTANLERPNRPIGPLVARSTDCLAVVCLKAAAVCRGRGGCPNKYERYLPAKHLFLSSRCQNIARTDTQITLRLPTDRRYGRYPLVVDLHSVTKQTCKQRIYLRP